MAMAPTQNRRLAVTKPSAMEGALLSPFTRCSVFFCTQSPRWCIRLSRSSGSPMTAPMTMDTMVTRLFCPFRLPLMPRKRMHRATPCMMMVCSRSPRATLFDGRKREKCRASQVRRRPAIEPARIARTLTIVPVSILILSLSV